MQGFSKIKLLLLLAVIAAMVDVGYQVIPIYDAKMSSQSVFDSICRNRFTLSEAEVRSKLPDILRVEYIDPNKDLPEAFFDNLVIVSADGKLDLSTYYHAEAWLLGMPAVFADLDIGAQPEDPLSLVEKVQVMARLDFNFDIESHTP
ncbi:MAG: hypothetical protein Q9M26_00935 [Mariprofundales bacterium]|nr:hypothetical protein [Mariprofundales bacterium]